MSYSRIPSIQSDCVNNTSRTSLELVLDPTEFNRNAWNGIATSRHQWFSPCTSEAIDRARTGEFSLRLTACKNVPRQWIGEVTGRRILALAAGGGHQGPILAAAGADVTVADLSEHQLAIDRRVAEEHSLPLKTLRADMADLSELRNEQFDMIVNPCSVNFAPNVRPIWKEATRVLRPDGVLLTGLMQPINFLFDAVDRDQGKLSVRFKIPYSDLDLPPDEREATLGPERPIDFGHSLTDLIGGQLDAGLQLTDMFEDAWGGDDVLSDHIATFLATRAIKR